MYSTHCAVLTCRDWHVTRAFFAFFKVWPKFVLIRANQHRSASRKQHRRPPAQCKKISTTCTWITANLDQLFVTQHVIACRPAEASSPNEAVKANLKKELQIEKWKHKLERVKVLICNPSASEGKVHLLEAVTKNSGTNRNRYSRYWPSTFKFNSGPNLGLFMYTRPAVDSASLTAELFKKSPWINWIGACGTPFSLARVWNLKRHLITNGKIFNYAAIMLQCQ